MIEEITPYQFENPTELHQWIKGYAAQRGKSIAEVLIELQRELRAKVEHTNALPKHLKQKKEPLKPYPVPSSNVWLTDTEVDALKGELGEDRLLFLAQSLHGYSFDHPSRYRAFTSHLHTIRNWNRRELGSGKIWAEHPKNGPGFYYPRDLKC